MTLLHIEHLTHYFGGLRAVQDFNLQLQPGELVAIIGPTRMEYARVATIVDYFGRALSRKIEESEEHRS